MKTLQFHSIFPYITPLLLMGTTIFTNIRTTTTNRGRKKHHHHQEVPKGCLAVKVGETDGEQQRFVVPVVWFNHPLFMQLLKEAEDEYGFEQKGTITIPCNVHHFRTIIGHIIHHRQHVHQQQQQHFGCFRVFAC